MRNVSRICPELGVAPVGYGRVGKSSVRACVSGRAQARSGLVREVPVARRTPGPEEAGAGLDLAGAAGYFTKRLAEDWLRETLSEAGRGTLPGDVRTGATFAAAAAEWLRYVSEDRDVKLSTLTDYRSVVSSKLLPAFGSLPIEELTPSLIEQWRAGLGADRAQPITNRTRNKSVTILGGIMERARKAYGLPSNPVRDVEKLRERYDATRFIEWQRDSTARTAARAEAVVARPDRACLDVSDRGRTSSSLDRQSRASTVTFVRRHGPHRRSPRL